MNHLRNFFWVLIIGIFMVSCSSDDDNNNSNEPIFGNYFPSISTNIWNYDVNNTSATNPDLDFENAPDFVTIKSSSGNTFSIEVNNGGIANGLMNGILSTGTMTISESTLEFSGNLQLPDEFAGFTDQTIDLDGFLLYDLNATNNSVMSEVSNSINEDLVINEDTLPLTIDYSLTSVKVGLSNTMTVNGESYSNVVRTKMVLKMDVYTTFPVLGNMMIIDDQEVVVAENYFAEDVGLIKSETTQSYQLNQVFTDILESFDPPIELGVATEFHMHNVQELDDYLVE